MKRVSALALPCQCQNLDYHGINHIDFWRLIKVFSYGLFYTFVTYCTVTHQFCTPAFSLKKSQSYISLLNYINIWMKVIYGNHLSLFFFFVRDGLVAEDEVTIMQMTGVQFGACSRLILPSQTPSTRRHWSLHYITSNSLHHCTPSAFY